MQNFSGVTLIKRVRWEWVWTRCFYASESGMQRLKSRSSTLASTATIECRLRRQCGRAVIALLTQLLASSCVLQSRKWQFI